MSRKIAKFHKYIICCMNLTNWHDSMNFTINFDRSVTLQRFIPLIAPEARTALVPGAPEPRMYPRSG